LFSTGTARQTGRRTCADSLEVPIRKLSPVATLRRNTARVLPIDPDGRALLMQGFDPLRPRDRFWFTVGGAAHRDEPLRAAAVREMREEVGLALDESLLGSPLDATSSIEWTQLGIRVVQDQEYYAVAVPAGTPVRLNGMGWVERLTIRRYAWLLPEELEADPVRSADPRLPDVMRMAVAAVREK
jgi:8-oxo-dGTP pyrophosphatase MutT (NUDIX family)